MLLKRLGKSQKLLETKSSITYLRETGWGGIDLIELTDDRGQWRVIAITIMTFTAPQNAVNSLSSSRTVGL
jgi:hypothetical protein